MEYCSKNEQTSLRQALFPKCGDEISGAETLELKIVSLVLSPILGYTLT
jgi:hypothetical protein